MIDEAKSLSGEPDHRARVDQRRADLRLALAPLLSAHPTIVLEVGCGHGHFLTAYAAARPTQICVGIDLSLDRIARAERKRVRAGLANLHFIRADADDFFASLPAGTFFSALFILFPDPWPKRRHHKNRLLQPAFVAQIAERAGQGARLHFRTDYKPYFAEAAETLRASSAWRLVDEPWPFEVETVFQRRAAGYQSLTALRRPADSPP